MYKYYYQNSKINNLLYQNNQVYRSTQLASKLCTTKVNKQKFYMQSLQVIDYSNTSSMKE